MDFWKLTRTRSSVRSYDPYRVPDESTILDILATASTAPSAVNRQPWKFHVIRSHAGLESVRAAYTRNWFLDVPCVIAVSGERKEAWTRAYDGFNSLETDLAIVSTFIVLAAQEKGLSTCWISNFEPQVLREALKLVPGEEIFFMTPLGYAAHQEGTVGTDAPGDAQSLPPKERKALLDLIQWK